MQNRKRDTDVQNRLLDSVGEGEGGMFRENSIKTCILSRVKQIASPGWMRQVLGPGALGRPRGFRWEGGSGWGIHVNPWLIHVNVRQKPLQYCKVISLQLIKINEKKKTLLTKKKSKSYQATILYTAKLASKHKSRVTSFLDKQKLSDFTASRSAFQERLESK